MPVLKLSIPAALKKKATPRITKKQTLLKLKSIPDVINITATPIIEETPSTSTRGTAVYEEISSAQRVSEAGMSLS